MKNDKKLFKGFAITEICRQDLVSAGLVNKDQAVKITDDQMSLIASKMEKAYCNDGFWIDLPIITSSVLEGYEKSNQCFNT